MPSQSWLLRLCVLAELFTNQHSMLADEPDTAAPTLPFDYRHKENFMDNGRQSVPRWNPDEDFSRFYGHKGSVVGPDIPNWQRYPERTMSSVFGEGLFWTLLATGLSLLFVIFTVIYCCYKNHQPLEGARGREGRDGGQELGNMRNANPANVPMIHIEPPSDDEEN